MRLGGATALVCIACGGMADSPPPLADAGPDPDGQFVPHEDAGKWASDGGPDRMTSHDGVIVAAPKVLVLYVGKPGIDSAPPADGFVDWLLGSSYWGLLQQYGVQRGVRVASQQVARSALLDPAVLDPGGLIWLADLDARLRTWVDQHGMQGANSLLVFLPDGVDVKLSVRGTYTYQTCIDAFGYHAFDGREPYAVMPACPKGRETSSIAHELVELVTNPQSVHGWFSNGDLPRGGGEVADVCVGRVAQIEGWPVAQLWSNANQQCEP